MITPEQIKHLSLCKTVKIVVKRINKDEILIYKEIDGEEPKGFLKTKAVLVDFNTELPDI